jgi:hypothetical protein
VHRDSLGEGVPGNKNKFAVPKIFEVKTSFSVVPMEKSDSPGEGLDCQTILDCQIPFANKLQNVWDYIWRWRFNSET